MRQGWCDIPSDLLSEIDEEMAYIEKVRVRATCVWWNSILPKLPNHNLPQLPWLLHTNVDNDGRKSQALFNLSEEKDYKIDVPQLEGKFLKGSTYGWLVTLSLDQTDTNPSSPEMCLLNPLTGVQFQLPPRSTFPDVRKYYPDRVGLEYCVIEDSGVYYREEDAYLDIDTNHVHRYLTLQVVISSPCIENCVVAATYSGVRKVAWCKPGDNKWTPVDIYSGTGLVGNLEDIIFSSNKLYVLNCQGHLIEVEFMGDLDPKITVIVGKVLEYERIGAHMFVVECSDQTLKLVVRTCKDAFEVHELDLENSCWRFTNNIRDDMVFLGYSHSFSIPTCQFPGYSGNRVYFADDSDLALYDECKDPYIYTYNIEDRVTQRLSGFTSVSRSIVPQPIWVTPPGYDQRV